MIYFFNTIAFFVVFFSSVSFSASAENEVLIFTYSYNRPDFIEIQHKTFSKFLKDPYKFVVFNDASDSEMNAKIHDVCARFNIVCIDIPQMIHQMPYLTRWPGEDRNHPSVRNCNVVQYSLDNYGFEHDGLVALFDSDLFLVRDFSIHEFMKNNVIAGYPQSKEKDGVKVEYLWIGMVFLDMSKMPNKQSLNFNCGRVNNVPVDAGGHSYYYLKDHPDLANYRLNRAAGPFFSSDEELKQFGFDENQITFIRKGPQNIEFFENGVFFHYRGGTNWDHMERKYHETKTNFLNEYIESILK